VSIRVLLAAAVAALAAPAGQALELEMVAASVEDFAEPHDIVLSPDGSRLYVADASGDRVAIFDVESGRELDSLGKRGKGAAEFYLPTAVEFDTAGNLMVVDQVNSRVQIFDAAGSFTRALYSDQTTGVV